nr:hypothetical protein [Polaromonas sp. JS666]
MNETRLQTTPQLQAFLAGTLEVRFCVPDSDEARYAHIVSVAQLLGYARLNRPDKGVVLRYLGHTSGYSRTQLTRLLARVLDGQSLHKRYRSPAHVFARRYTTADALLLAEVDRAHGTLSGPATVHLLKRALAHGDSRFERLAGLSVSHLYNLRRGKTYQGQRVSLTKTRAVVDPIGIRRAPRPQGRAGFIRIDSVHQGDPDGTKGSITSMRWTSSPSGKSWPPVSASARPICCPCSRTSSSSFRSRSWDFTRTTAASSSTGRWRSCWRSCAWSRPNHAPAIPTTTPWPRARTAR